MSHGQGRTGLIGWIWEKAREYASNAIVGGAILVLTGFTPEHWIAEILHNLHISDIRSHWPSFVDGRLFVVSLGVALIAGDALWRRHRAAAARPAPVAAEPGVGNSSAPTAGKLPLPDKPSIAVLPFQNMSADPEQDYLADGVVEEITTALSRVKWFFVIARNSSFTYKGRAVNVKQVGRELGVRYILEGSVRRFGDIVRIAGQLVEAETGNHLWADRFDGSYADLFELQDRITENVIATIEPALRNAEITRAKSKRPENLTAYDRYIKALSHFYLGSRDGIVDAERLLAEAMKIDPGYAPSYALAAQCKCFTLTQGWSENLKDTASSGAALARQAIERDSDDPNVLWMAGHALAYCGNDYEAALRLLDKALKLNPNSAWAYCWSGWAYAYAGQPELAIDHLQAAIRLSPLDRMIFVFQSGLAIAFCMLQRHEEAVTWAQKAIDEQPTWTAGYRPLISSLSHLGRLDEARAAAQRMLSLQPTYQIEVTARAYRDSPGKSAFIDGLRRAGLPD